VSVEDAAFLFKKMSFALGLADRVAEKVIIINDDKANICTNAFLAELKSPFEKPLKLVLYKTVTDSLGVFAELAKTSFEVSFTSDMDLMYVYVDNKYLAVFKAVTNVEGFLSPKAKLMLSFKPNVIIQNDAILRLAQVATSFDYLNNVLSLELSADKLQVSVLSSDLSRKMSYDLSITTEGAIVPIEMKFGSTLLKSYLEMAGSVAKYSFSESGIGLEIDKGKFLICRQS
jgi:hypothetical protein